MFFLERSENQFFGAPSAYFMKKWRFWHPNGTPWGPKWRPKSPQIHNFIRSCNTFSGPGRSFSRPGFPRPQGHPPEAFRLSFWLHFLSFLLILGHVLFDFGSIWERCGNTLPTNIGQVKLGRRNSRRDNNYHKLTMHGPQHTTNMKIEHMMFENVATCVYE